MRKQAATLSLLVVLLAGWLFRSHASLSFYGYQRVQYGDSLIDSVRYVQKSMGSVQLEVSHITVTPHGGYLDIVEDAWVSGNLTWQNQPDVADHYLVKGTVSLCAKAALTGIITWKYGVAYRAELYPTEYIYDQSYPDSATLVAQMNSQMAFVQKTSGTAYNITISNVDLGERRHIRIRYLLPNEGGGKAHYQVPVLCDPGYSYTRPERLRIAILVDEPSQAFTLYAPHGPVQVGDSNAVVIDYQSTVSIERTAPVTSVVHKTTFASGPWQGTYIQLNTSVPDTVLYALSKPLEAVVLWRWNAPFDFVEYQSDRLGLTGYASNVVSQAQSIRRLIEELSRTNHRVGLVHSVEGDPLVSFAAARPGESGYSDMLSYISSFSPEHLFEAYRDEPDPRPNWAPLLSSDFGIDDARDEFSRSLNTVRAMYTGDTSALRHVVLLSQGTAAVGYSDLTAARVDSLLGGVTVYSQNAQWHGVDIMQVMPTVWSDNHQTVEGIRFPVFRPTTVHLRVDNLDMPYAFPLSGHSAVTFAIGIMTIADWNTTLHWYGYDEAGNLIRQTQTEPEVYESAQDSGLAKVWAADGSHVAEREVDNPGGVYGFVTKAMFLRAGREHATADSSVGVGFLSSAEIHLPVAVHTPRKELSAARTVSHAYARGVLTLRVAGSFGLARIRIYTLDGRLLLELDPRRFCTGSDTYVLSLAALRTRLPHQVLVISLQGRCATHSFPLATGGAL